MREARSGLPRSRFAFSRSATALSRTRSLSLEAGTGSRFQLRVTLVLPSTFFPLATPTRTNANRDIKDLFCSVGANSKNVRCFDGRTVGGAVRYNTSYATVDFKTLEDAKAAFEMFKGRKAYPGSYHLRLKFVDVNGRSFGRRMVVSMGPMERSEEERKGF